MQKRDLRLCPFCDGEAQIIQDLDKYVVGCSNDECLGFSGLSWLYDSKEEATLAWNTRGGSYDYLKEIYDWAFFNMECCDEPEWSLFTGITSVIAKYWRETSKPSISSDIPDDYYDIEF